MDAPATPSPADTLPRATHYQVAHSLRALLPLSATDTPEDAARRHSDAMAHVASLHPATPDEASLAAYYVAAGAQAADCIRLARANPNDVVNFLKCTAQSASMMRQAHRWRTALLGAQAGRRQREADPATSDTAQPAEPPTFDTPLEPPASPPPAPQPEPPAAANLDDIAQAERFALIHRSDAILLRRGRHVPNNRRANLPPGALRALLTGTSPLLCSLDKKSHQAPAAAA